MAESLGKSGAVAPGGKSVWLGFLPALEVIPLDDVLGRQAGVLLGRARRDDVLDAALALLAMDGDLLSTSDGSDLASLVRFPAFTSNIVAV